MEKKNKEQEKVGEQVKPEEKVICYGDGKIATRKKGKFNSNGELIQGSITEYDWNGNKRNRILRVEGKLIRGNITFYDRNGNIKRIQEGKFKCKKLKDRELRTYVSEGKITDYNEDGEIINEIKI